MIVISCPDCGKALLWHLAHEHRCDKQPQKSSPSKKPTTSPVTKTEASSVSSPSSRLTDESPVITPAPDVITPAARNHAPRNHVITPVITPVITATQKEAARQARWREKNREAYNARMRDYRARQKAPE